MLKPFPYKVQYTRYCDDLIFSTKDKNVCKELYPLILETIKNYSAINLRINKKKTHFGSISKGNVLITGLKVTPQNEITVTKQKKDEVRLLLSLASKNKLNEEDIPKLKGNLAFIKDVSPKLYTKLQMKYFTVIKNL
jgi:hypothetical protein